MSAELYSRSLSPTYISSAVQQKSERPGTAALDNFRDPGGSYSFYKAQKPEQATTSNCFCNYGVEVKPHFARILPLNMIYMFGYQ